MSEQTDGVCLYCGGDGCVHCDARKQPNPELEFYRGLDISREPGVTSIGGETTRKLHELWENERQLRDRLEAAESEIVRVKTLVVQMADLSSEVIDFAEVVHNKDWDLNCSPPREEKPSE